jgi:hypothetical protein
MGVPDLERTSARTAPKMEHWSHPAEEKPLFSINSDLPSVGPDPAFSSISQPMESRRTATGPQGPEKGEAMHHKSERKLQLRKETLRELDSTDLLKAAGGAFSPKFSSFPCGKYQK